MDGISQLAVGQSAAMGNIRGTRSTGHQPGHQIDRLIEQDFGRENAWSGRIQCLELTDRIVGLQVDARREAQKLPHLGLGGCLRQAVAAHQSIGQSTEGRDHRVIVRRGHRDDVGQPGGNIRTAHHHKLPASIANVRIDDQRIAAVVARYGP